MSVAALIAAAEQASDPHMAKVLMRKAAEAAAIGERPMLRVPVYLPAFPERANAKSVLALHTLLSFFAVAAAVSVVCLLLS